MPRWVLDLFWILTAFVECLCTDWYWRETLCSNHEAHGAVAHVMHVYLHAILSGTCLYGIHRLCMEMLQYHPVYVAVPSGSWCSTIRSLMHCHPFVVAVPSAYGCSTIRFIVQPHGKNLGAVLVCKSSGH